MADAKTQFMEYALGLLARRAYSAAQLKKKLVERLRKRGAMRDGGAEGDADAVIDAVIMRLRELRYLDDLRYAERWVEERSRLKPRGKRLLTQELRLKGISPETIAQVWEGDRGRLFAEDEVRLAEQVAQKKRGQLEGKLGGKNGGKYQGRELKNRLFSHLAGRGFSYETIGKVVERFF